MTRRLPFHYGWVVVGITFLVLLSGAGIRSTPGILMVPLEEEFHWSRATIGFAASLNLVLYGLIGPFAVAIMDRYGVRRCVVAALVLVGAGVAATALMTQSWQLILAWGLLVGAGTGFLATVLVATIAARWFETRRGLVIGILSGGSSAGQLIFLPLLANITATAGWRTTVLTIAAVIGVIVPLVILLLRNRPSDVGLQPYGQAGEPKAPSVARGNPVTLAFATLRSAVHVREFWLLGAAFFVCGASTNGLIGTHLIPTCIDYGYSEVVGAALLATIGFFNFIGTLASGWLSDRFDNRILLMVYFGLRGLSLLYLPFSFSDYYTMSIFAMFYGLDWFATVAPTVKLLTASFGAERGPLVYGWVFVFHQLGGGAAAFLAGVFRESSGSYTSSFLLAGIMCLLAALGVLFLGNGRPLDRTKPVTV